MRAVIQRVDMAKVEVEGCVIAKISKGLLVYLGITGDDMLKDVQYIADKICNLRIFKDQNDKMNRSVTDINGSVLIVSQFTLQGDCRKGRRPGFVNAGAPDYARKLYQKVIEQVTSTSLNVQTGKFAAEMKITCVNDGPVTMLLDSTKLF